MASRHTGPFARGGGDPLVSIYREMNRMFDDVLGGALGTGNRAPGALMPTPSLDVHEQDDELCVSLELPGVKPGDVDVRLDGEMLTITGEKKNADEQKQAHYHVMERSYGRFSRSLQLPFRPDPEQVRARFDNGVLTVRLKRAQQQGSRRIEVRSGDGPSDPGPAGGSGAPASAGAAQPAPRNDEAGYGVAAGSATEGSGPRAGSGAMGSTGTEAGSSQSVGP